MRRGSAALAAATTLMMGLAGGVLPASGTEGPPGHERAEPGPTVTVATNADRDKVQIDVYKRIVDQMDQRFYWDGDVASCSPGTSRNDPGKANNVVDELRDLVHLGVSAWPEVLTVEARAAALMTAAAGTFRSDPPADAHCATPDGLAGSRDGVGAIGRRLRLITDAVSGAGDPDLTWRRRILAPTQDPTFGIGAADGARVLVAPESTGLAVPGTALRAWPSAGYFPMALEPGGRWSLTGVAGEIDFSAATVVVTDAGGAQLPVTHARVIDDSTATTLAWDLAGLPGAGALAADEALHVTVDGARVSGSVAPLAYDVVLMPEQELSVDAKGFAITGQLSAGSRLGITRLKYTPTQDDQSCQWFRDGAAVDGDCTGHVVTADDPGHRITVTVTALREFFRPNSITTGYGDAPLPGTLALKAGVAISGSGTAFKRMALKSASIEPQPTKLDCQWLLDGAPIPGATDCRYFPDASTVGGGVSLQITAHLSGYEDLVATSRVVTIRPAHIRPVSRPVITVAGRRLSASTGTWSATPETVIYQWTVAGVDVPGATGSTYRVRQTDAHKLVRVIVTVGKPGYITQSKASAAVRVQ
ncbi:hypothetical protein NLS1_12690 [Nocardioides sp. LS1]|nr:hypothetical protein NLS1_12690 [Nocardioides sp. LS1]